MDKDAAINALAQFRKALAEEGAPSARLILFGSHARGDAREESDIDVVVVSDAFQGMAHWDRITLLSKAICASNVLIEAIPMTPNEWENRGSLVAEFAREGEEVLA